MTCLINTLIKNFIPCVSSQNKVLISKCPTLGCLIQPINNADINASGNGLSILSADLPYYDINFLSSLLSCENGVKSTIIEQIYNPNTGIQITNLYPVICTATSNCNVINILITGNFSFGSNSELYAFVLGCNSCNLGNSNLTKSIALDNCEKCLIFALVQNPNNICNILNIPGEEWFDITPYIDITGTIDSIGYYYLNSCIYDTCKEFNVYLQIPPVISRDTTPTYTPISGFIKINKCGVSLKVLIRICKTTSISLYNFNGFNNPSYITGTCVTDINLLNINVYFYTG